MKQAIIHYEEIKRLQEAVRKTKSEKLRRDYIKAIKRKKDELKEYCGSKGLNLETVVKE